MKNIERVFTNVTEQRHRTMSKIHRADTKPEIILRKALWHKGYRYRKNWKKLPGSPDIVLTKQKLCIFVDSEYFHGKNWEDGLKEKVKRGNNSTYWVKKISENIERDNTKDSELKGLGYKTIHFWSRDIEKQLDECLAIIDEILFEQMIGE